MLSTRRTASRGHLRDCEIFAYLRTTFVSSSSGHTCYDHVAVVDTVDFVHLVLAHAVVKHLVVVVQHEHHLDSIEYSRIDYQGGWFYARPRKECCR